MAQETQQYEQIVIRDFSSMDLSGLVGSKSSHYLLQNVQPDYILNSPGTQEEQYAPLAASLKPVLLNGALDGNVVKMIPSPVSAYSVFVVTDTRHIYAFDTYYDLGQPLGAGVGDGSGQLSIFGNYLIYTNSASTSIAYMNLTTRVWNTIASAVATGGVRYLAAFLDFCAVVDGDAGQNNARYVKKLTTSLTAPLGTGIDVGTNYQIVGLKNYANKFLAIAAGYGSVSSYVKNQLFLWNGTSSTYNYAVPMPGQFLDMDVVDGQLFVALALRPNTTAVYKLVGLQLQFQFFSQYSNITKLFNAWNKVSLATGAGILNWYVADRHEFSYYLINGTYTAGAAGGLNNYLYLGSGTSVYYYPASGSYADILYISKYIQPKSFAGTVAFVDVYYDTPPAGAGDQINVSLYAVDETGSSGPLGNTVAVLSQITSTTKQNPKFTRLDGKSLYFNKVAPRISTQSATGWFPKILSLVINYEPVNG